METFTGKMITNVKSVPKGKVATYGQIARLSGNPRAARQVARLLHTLSEKHALPWHRIINSQGKISLQPAERQAVKLIAEGVEIINGIKVDLSTYQWQPDDLYEDWLYG